MKIRGTFKQGFLHSRREEFMWADLMKRLFPRNVYWAVWPAWPTLPGTYRFEVHHDTVR